MIFKLLNVLKVSDLLKLHELKFYFSYVNDYIPEFFRSIIQIPEIPYYTTRQSYVLQPYIPRLKLLENQVRHHLPNTINVCPVNIINKCYSHSLGGYSNYIKRILLEEYQEQCNIRDCYTCRIIADHNN